MKDKLEQFIKENRTDFDTYEPSAKVWENISTASQKKRNKLSYSIIKYSAAACVIFAIGFGAGQFQHNENSGILSYFRGYSQIEAEVIENEYYYLTKINENMQQLQPYFADDPQLRDDIEIDFDELDKYCQELKNDLQDDINNDYVIEALIKSYQTKLHILQSLLQQLSPQENEKIEYDI